MCNNFCSLGCVADPLTSSDSEDQSKYIVDASKLDSLQEKSWLILFKASLNKKQILLTSFCFIVLVMDLQGLL